MASVFPFSAAFVRHASLYRFSPPGSQAPHHSAAPRARARVPQHANTRRVAARTALEHIADVKFCAEYVFSQHDLLSLHEIKIVPHRSH